MTVIKTENLTKTYNPKSDNPVHALKGANLSIEEGETVAIVGPSGCGKSTLLHILGCLDEPTEGTYLLNGEKVDYSNNGKAAKLRGSEIGFVLQSYGLIGERTVFDNVIIPLIFAGKDISEEEKNVDAVLDRIGILPLKKKKCRDLSGGEKQRAAIARALLNHPNVLLADEPTGALDEATGRSIMELFMKINKENGTTIVVVTHDPNVAAFCDRTIRLHDGQIIVHKK